MQLKNTEDQYGLIAKFFHWSVAVMIIALLPVGLFMAGMENSPLKFQVYALHKSVGLLVFFLGLGRIAWRLISPAPDHFENHAHWERVLAGASHFWLYVCVIGMPLSGWLMSSAGEFPVPFFGIQMPHLIGKDEQLAGTLNNVHEILGYTLMLVLGLHIAGALKHHVIDKDETLMRMAWARPGLLLPVIVILVAGLSYSVSAIMIGRQIIAGETGEEAAVDGAPGAAPSAVRPETANLPEHGWAIDPARSKVEFKAVLYNAPFTGIFSGLDGKILFDPADLSTARADVTVRMNGVKTGDADRDANIESAEWFDAANFPESRFVANRFEKGGEPNGYVAIGDVTIKGVTMPLLIPFRLDIDGDSAHMTATFSLNRTSFAVGQGQWADESTVAHNVDVTIDLTVVH